MYFAKLTKPFIKCVKKGEKNQHNKEFIEILELCKNILFNELVLQYLIFTKPLILPFGRI